MRKGQTKTIFFDLSTTTRRGQLTFGRGKNNLVIKSVRSEVITDGGRIRENGYFTTTIRKDDKAALLEDVTSRILADTDTTEYNEKFTQNDNLNIEIKPILGLTPPSTILYAIVTITVSEEE